MYLVHVQVVPPPGACPGEVDPLSALRSATRSTGHPEPVDVHADLGPDPLTSATALSAYVRTADPAAAEAAVRATWRRAALPGEPLHGWRLLRCDVLNPGTDRAGFVGFVL